MPRRHHRQAESYEPLDLTPPPVGNYHRGARVGDPVSFNETHAARQERLQREQDYRQRQINARINRGIDWHVCIVPGCGGDLTSKGRVLNPTGGRDHTLELPLCYTHLAVAGAQAQRRRNDPLIVSAVAEVIERRQARTLTEHEADKKARLSSIDGHIYYVRLNGMIKVGWSREIENRLRAYGPSAEVLVIYAGTRDDETMLHRQLKPARARGHEWYEDGPILADFIAKALEQHGPPKIPDTWTRPKQVVAGKRHR